MVFMVVIISRFYGFTAKNLRIYRVHGLHGFHGFHIKVFMVFMVSWFRSLVASWSRGSKAVRFCVAEFRTSACSVQGVPFRPHFTVTFEKTNNVGEAPALGGIHSSLPYVQRSFEEESHAWWM